MQIITLLNEKGGVGKTTLSLTLAMGLARMQKRVMVLDTDSQGHVSASLGLEATSGLYDLLIRQAAWGDVLTAYQELTILSSNIETRGIPLMMQDSDLLRRRLHQWRGKLDFVIIDTSPTPSLLQAAILRATDAVLYPTRLAALSIDGLLKSLQRVKEHGIEIIGIVPTMYRANTLEHRDNLRDMRAHFRGQVDVFNPIHQSILWEEAQTANKIVFDHAPAHDASKQAWDFIKAVANYYEGVGV